MEVLILDALLRPIDLIDEFLSLIWTEKFAAVGDFQLVTAATNANRNRFVKGTMLMIPSSDRIMIVQTTEDTIDEKQGATLTIKGFDLLYILEKRISASLGVGSHEGMLLAVTYFNGWTPLQLLNDMVWRICVSGSTWQLSDGDSIPFLNDWHVNPGSLYPTSNLPEPEPAGILWEQKIASLYSAITDVAKAYDLGFRFYKDPASATLYFEGYVSTDRTTAQTVYPPVVFSSDMQNLQNTTEYIDDTPHYNVVIAVYEYKNEEEGGYPETLTISEIVSDPELAYSAGGFDQKVKSISISKLPDGMELIDVPAYLQQLGKEELTRSRSTDVIDGEVDENAEFVYGKDYYLGDLVEIRSDNGGVAFMRVEEHIIKEDQNGIASYPSLVSKTSITPGTWASWKYDVDWVDMGSGEFWSNQ